MTWLLPLLLLLLPPVNDPQPVPPTPVPASGIDLSNTDLRTPYEPFPNLLLIEALQTGLNQATVVRVLSVAYQGSIPVPDPPRPNRASLDRYWGEFGGDRLIDGDGPIPPAAVGPINADLLIARHDANLSIWDFKAEVMAVLRSVEQAYWTLWQAQEAEAALQGAAEQVGAAIRREQDDLVGGRGGITADLAEAEEIRDALQPRLLAAQAARGEALGQLLDRLGWDPALDWSEPFVASTRPPTSVDRPDLARARRQLDKSEPRLNRARAALLAAQFTDLGQRADTRAPEAARDADPAHLLANLQQACRDSEAALGRALASLNTAADAAQTAGNARTKTSRRLAAQRGFYDEGRITLDRWVGAIVADTDARIAEAQALAQLSKARVAFHEAQGTLVTHDGVNVMRSLPPRHRAYIQAHRVPLDSPPAAAVPTP